MFGEDVIRLSLMKGVHIRVREPLFRGLRSEGRLIVVMIPHGGYCFSEMC